MNNKQKYDKIIRTVFKIDESDIINENMNRDNTLGWDSLLQLTLITSLEDEFSIMLDTEDILNLDSYKKGLKIIEKYTD